MSVTATAPSPTTLSKLVKLTINLPRVVRDGTQALADKHNHNLTEEIRRALSFWKYVDEQRSSGRRILTEDEQGNLREIVFND
jgi:hypothetical protein